MRWYFTLVRDLCKIALTRGVTGVLSVLKAASSEARLAAFEQR